MTKFDREKALAEHLLRQLNLSCIGIYDPNAAGPESGIDVAVGLSEDRVIGIQVTEIDPHAVRGTGVPENGAVASTFVMTPWLSADDMNLATDALLQE